jgi:hypothetical protein
MTKIVERMNPVICLENAFALKRINVESDELRKVRERVAKAVCWYASRELPSTTV